MFNVLQGRIAQERVLDLFAGSGALGLEALSRGAAHAVFCDASRTACQTVRKNILTLGVQAAVTVLCMDWRMAVGQLASEGQRFGLIFVDPPYGLDANQVVKACSQHGLLEESGMMIVEHDADTALIVPSPYTLWKTKVYRGTQLDFITL